VEDGEACVAELPHIPKDAFTNRGGSNKMNSTADGSPALAVVLSLTASALRSDNCPLTLKDKTHPQLVREGNVTGKHTSHATGDNRRDFAGRVKELRVRLVGKQALLAETIGMTEGAVSRWESGARLPGGAAGRRLILALEAAGASSMELDRLERAWKSALVARFEPSSVE
jgi:DNA-binding transcriptional regulator YiaG